MKDQSWGVISGIAFLSWHMTSNIIKGDLRDNAVWLSMDSTGEIMGALVEADMYQLMIDIWCPREVVL